MNFIFEKNLVMDAKVTLSFSGTVADKAKRYAEKNNISLSRLVEFLLDKVTSKSYTSFEEFPVSDWVNEVSEGEAVYQTKARSSKAAKKEFYNAKK